MRINNWFYLSSEKDLEKLFDLIKDDYESIILQKEKTGEIKYQKELLEKDELKIRVKWKLSVSAFDELKEERATKTEFV